MSRTIAAGKFKAECLALLDRVARTGESLVVTIKFQGDVVGPFFEDWDPGT